MHSSNSTKSGQAVPPDDGIRTVNRLRILEPIPQSVPSAPVMAHSDHSDQSDTEQSTATG